MDGFKVVEKPFNQTMFENNIVRFIVLSEQSFRLVENESFHELLQSASGNSSLSIFSRGTLRKRIEEHHDTYFQTLRAMLQATPGKISVSLDMWTTKTSFLPFLGILAHWIPVDWKRHSMLLGFKHLPASHTGNNMAGALVKTLEKFGIVSNVALHRVCIS